MLHRRVEGAQVLAHENVQGLLLRLPADMVRPVRGLARATAFDILWS